MQEFYQWVIFMGFIALLAGGLFAVASGWIQTARTRTDSFREWQRLNGGVIRMMCILIIVVCGIVCVYKYNDVKAAVEAPPTLQTD